MKKQEYVEQFDGAPYELYEFAESAASITDDEHFVSMAKAYLKAKRDFENALKEANIQPG